jgi:hypothetical protein
MRRSISAHWPRPRKGHLVQTVRYDLPFGTSALYPPVSVLSPNPPVRLFPLDKQTAWTSLNDVIQHYTLSSLACEGVTKPVSIEVVGNDQGGVPFSVIVEVQDDDYMATLGFAANHVLFLQAGFKALNGVQAMRETAAWNPLSGYQVNSSDGLCQWSLCLPLGMAVKSQAAVTLMHYPPSIAMEHADYLYNNTLSRWQNLLTCCGITGNMGRFTTIVDVNPVSAPGSGQSEYDNDYFPIMMSSLFFDNAKTNADYIRLMLYTLLNFEGELTTATLPLLVCGSPTYDPQAPGWFRVAFKDQMPQVRPSPDRFPDLPGIPTADVMQAGWVKLAPGWVQTPYMVANHMIAAGVMGRNTGTDWSNAAKLPDIRQYEAQDLTAAEFLRQMSAGLTTDPVAARLAAWKRWYGNTTGTGVPCPPDDGDKESFCAMALVDLYFNDKTVQPYYTLAEALTIVKVAVQNYGVLAYNPCNTTIYPPPTG